MTGSDLGLSSGTCRWCHHVLGPRQIATGLSPWVIAPSGGDRKLLSKRSTNFTCVVCPQNLGLSSDLCPVLLVKDLNGNGGNLMSVLLPLLEASVSIKFGLCK